LPEHHPVTFEDGSFRFPTLPRRTLAEYVRHAEKFGTELVYETAEQDGLPAKELALLRVEIDYLVATAKSGGYSVGKKRQRSKEETAKAVELLSVAGLTRREIAEKMVLSDKTVDRYLAA
jgi:DNA-directed RNA polymerase specialized sigma24 family protein